MVNETNILRGEAFNKSAEIAVNELAEQIKQPDMGGMLFFCSADYDLDEIATHINEHFDCPVIGCTTAGEIGSRFFKNSIIGLSLPSSTFHLKPKLIHPLKTFNPQKALDLFTETGKDLQFTPAIDIKKSFGFLLIDGLSVMEEPVTAALYHAFNGLNIIGGSAGDSLKFTETKVFADGRFWSDAAVFTFFETKLPFEIFKLQHFLPSETDIVITEADPRTRTVYEINGGPAAEEYANLLKLDKTDLNPQVFSNYPLMLQIGSEWYVRSVSKMNEDGSLTFFCAIDDGLPLTIAKDVGFVETLRKQVDDIKNIFPKVALTIGCDCILRRLEIQQKHYADDVEKLLNQINFFGFSTFGEQFNAVHVNQTLTGIVFGEK